MDAFDSLLVSGRIETDEDRVFAVLEEIGPADDKRILWAIQAKIKGTYWPAGIKKAYLEKWAINAVTGRRNGLMTKNPHLLEDCGIYKHRDRIRPVHVYRIRGDKREPGNYGYREYKKKPPASPPAQTEKKQGSEAARRQLADSGRPVVDKLSKPKKQLMMFTGA